MSDTYQVAVEAMENRQARLTVTIPDVLADPVLRKTAKRVSGEIRIAGFRPGKAPYDVIMRRVGRDALVQESLDALFDLSYPHAIAESKLEPGGRPTLADYTSNPISLTLVVPLQPLVDLGDYRTNLRVPEQPVVVTDADVEKLLDEMRDQRSAWAPVERPARFGDMVTVDITGMSGDDQVIQREGWDMELSETDDGLVPGLNAEFVGMAVGESKTFVLTYPDSSTSVWAGHAVDFNTTMQAVKAKTYPTDEELAQETGEFPDFAVLRSHLAANLEEERRNQAEMDYRRAVLDALIESALALEYPTQMSDDELGRVLDDYKNEYRNMGLDFESYLSYTQQTVDQVREKLRPMAENRVKQRLVLATAARAEHVHIHAEDLTAEIEATTQTMTDEQAEKYRSLMHSAGGQLYMLEQLVNRRTLDRLVAIAQGNPPPLEDHEHGEQEGHGETGDHAGESAHDLEDAGDATGAAA